MLGFVSAEPLLVAWLIAVYLESRFILLLHRDDSLSVIMMNGLCA